MVNAKISIMTEENTLPREKLIRQMEDRFQNASILYIWGETGCGKTTAVYHFLKKHGQVHNAYLQLDQHDNCFAQFAEGLISMGETLKLFSKDMFQEKSFQSISDVHEIYQQLLETMENKKEQYCLVFDQMQMMTDKQLKAEMKWFLLFLPRNCRVMILSREDFPEEIKELFYKGKIAVFSAKDFLFDKSEIRDYFYKKKKRITVDQVNDIYQLTGGWPGAVAMLNAQKIQEHGQMHKGKQHFHIFVREWLWNRLTDDEKKLLCYCNAVPFFSREFCLEVFQLKIGQEDLFRLENRGMIVYDWDNDQYKISPVIQSWLNEVEPPVRKEEMAPMRKRAISWYREQGEIRAIFEMLEDAGEIEEALIEYAKDLVRILTIAEIKEYLSCCGGNKKTAELSYLKGWVVARENQGKAVDQELEFLWQMCQKAGEKETAGKYMEFYMNLLFADSRIDICQWIQLLKENWIYEGKLHLFSVSAGSPLIGCGLKNFAPVFAGKIKEERSYMKIWDQCLDREGRIAMELAKYDFYIQTDRWEKVYEWMQSREQEIMECNHGELLAGLCYLMFYLRRKKVSYNFKEDMEFLINKLKHSRELHVWENCYVLNTFLSENESSSDEMGKWLLYESPEEQETEIRENSYLLNLKSKCYLQMNQYEKAVNLCEKLAEFFGKTSLNQLQTDCIFEQAVALYEMGEKNEATIRATRAITLGMKYRYVELYTFYGETGVCLVEEYQKIAGIKVSGKKQYYYGNVLRANYEGYQSILLRCVKKARQQAVVSKGSNRMKYGKLTMTELTILRYINNGYGNQEIGEAMNIKTTTVKSHVYNIYKKLGVSTRVQAVNEAKIKGII